MVIEEIDIEIESFDDEDVSLGCRGATGKQFDWRDSSFFVSTGGRMMENLLFRGIIDSLYTMDVVVPPTDGTSARRYARWEANDRLRRTATAREWVREELPQYWNNVFRYRFDNVLAWLEAKWVEIDEHPTRAMSARRMVSDCLVEDYHNG